MLGRKAFSTSALAGALGGALLLAGFAGAARAETLSEVIAEVYRSNPDLRAAREQMLALTETYSQARAGWRPTVNAQSVLSHETDAPNTTNTSGQPSPFNSAATSLNVTQPLYTGGRALAAIEEAKRNVMSGQERLRSREQQILLAAATAYADLQLYQRMVEISRLDLDALHRQLDQTEAEQKAGDASRTDVAQARTRVSQAEADLASRRADYEIARANFIALTGLTPASLAPAPDQLAALPKTLDEAFSLAEQYNPDISAAKEQAASSQAAVEAAKAQIRPYVNLQGTLAYGANVGANGNAFAPGTRQVVGSVTCNMPLYSGGSVLSQIRQAKHTHNADAIGIESQRRTTVSSVAQAWTTLQLAGADIASYSAEIDSAGQAAEGMRKEQQAGYRETIEVLNADLELRNAELSLAQAHHDAFVSGVTLLARIGRLDVEVLAPGTPRTDTDKALRRASRQIGWVPWEEGVGLIDHVAEPKMPPLPSIPLPGAH